MLGSSLFVALVINPVLTAAFMKVGAQDVNRQRSNVASVVLVGVGLVFLALGVNALGNILVIAGIMTLLNTYVLYPATLSFQNSFLPRLEAFYERFLTFVLGAKDRGRFSGGLLDCCFCQLF